MNTTILYGLERSVYTRIARLALEEKGVPYVLREVEIFGPDGVPSGHLRRHPFGRIPVLDHDGFELYETSAITCYVDEGFPGPRLQPRSARARARMNQVVGLLDAYAYRPMVWGVFVERVSAPLEGGTTNEAAVAGAIAASTVCLSALDRIVAAPPFLLGEGITLADLHAYPMLRYLSLAPEGDALLARYPRLQAWQESMSGRPSVIRTLGRYERAPRNPPARP